RRRFAPQRAPSLFGFGAGENGPWFEGVRGGPGAARRQESHGVPDDVVHVIAHLCLSRTSRDAPGMVRIRTRSTATPARRGETKNRRPGWGRAGSDSWYHPTSPCPRGSRPQPVPIPRHGRFANGNRSRRRLLGGAAPTPLGARLRG